MTKKCNHVDNSCREEKLGCDNCAYNNEEKIIKVNNDGGMIIKTKYKIGERVWVVDENMENKQVDVYSEIITGVFIDEDGKVWYLLKELLDDVLEDKLIPYYDLTKLATTVFEIDKRLNEERGEK